MFQSVPWVFVRGYIQFAALLVACLLATGTLTLAAAPGALRPAPDSPLTSDEDWIYAIAEDQQTLLRTPLKKSGEWETLATHLPCQRITGLAYSGGLLFAADGGDASIYELELTSGQHRVLFKGEPLQSPGDLAVLHDLLVIADAGGNTLLGLELGEDRPILLPLIGRSLGRGPYFLASADNDLIISSPTEGSITYTERSRLTREYRYSILQQSAGSEKRGSSSSPSKGPTDVAKSRHPEISGPKAVALHHGIVYVINDKDGQVYAFSQHARRPVRLVQRGMEVAKPTRLLMNGATLLVLDGESGRLLRWPRMVPAEVRVSFEISEAMTDLYRFLFRAGNLTTKSVPLRRNIENTLRGERVLLAPYVASLEDVLCELNRPLCPKGNLRTILQEGELITVPDLPSESYVDARQIELDGKHTLGEVVDNGVQSEALYDWRSNVALQRMNPQFRRDPFEPAAGMIRDERSGRFTVPVELVRYTVAIQARAFLDRELGLHGLLVRYPALSVISQERLMAKTKASPQDTLPPPPWDSLHKEYADLLKVISYQHSPLLSLDTARVGVADDTPISCDSLEFEGSACERLPDEALAVNATATVSPPPTDDQIRPFDRDIDHGMAVASLIAARRTRFQAQGLAPDAVIVPLPSEAGALAEYLRRAILYGVRIFNLSHHYGIDPPPDVLSRLKGLDEKIQQYTEALFVVAAGNEGEEKICETKKAYPVCWGDRPNVLVVGATDRSGKFMLPGFTEDGKSFPGSNSSGTSVHILAPGEGFHVPGRNRGYVPVRGTSFAAPLVTAAAALLFSQGISEPPRIKHRIIATTDIRDQLNGKARGGSLNVHRAVMYPTRTVLVTPTSEKPVELLPNQTLLVPARHRNLSISFRNVRRIVPTGTGYRIYYVELDEDGNESELKLLDATPDPRTPWKFKYRALGQNLAPQGQPLEADVTQFADFIGACATR